MLYKYVVPKRVDVLENGLIRFTQAAALNDPFETYPCFTLFRSSLEERSRRLLKTVEGQFDAHSIDLGLLKIPSMVRDRVAELQRDLGAGYPMLSLTKKRNNLLMWSHYADAHRGFVIGFDSNNSFFHQERPRNMTPLGEGKYSAKRPVLPSYEECLPENVYETVFLTKSDHWSYEEELRMFAQPQAANASDKAPDGSDLFLFNFPADCLREIIFGYQMPANSKGNIAEVARNRYPGVDLFEAQLNETDFDLDVARYGG